ncbi:putative DNA-binding protein [Mesorhizobium plurifarium]|uniref:Putative DNA-binding protein n=1 Tax=Mesorhizobium plurifarium TaxID=69974 RepID=A0A0K2VN81_MESPL|nr:putative DNA-binding protein [Mesorhizobium plurifarium]
MPAGGAGERGGREASTGMKPRENATRKDVIQIRAPAGAKAMLSRAANLRGENLSEFVLGSALKQAEETILDQRIFLLDADAHQEFLELLDAPDRPSEELRGRMVHRPAWDR